MPKLSDDEVATFLDEPGHLLRLATIDDDGMPRLAPVWFTTIIHEVGNDDEWRSIYREIACRFIAPEAADRYLAATLDQPRALVAVDLDDATVTTWRMPVADEAGTGIWASRYYAAGSRMATALES
ncbi:MAG: pyridoxamine 5'-phosphate oxidase family protein [Actinomycetia bacterium]|nr:pyridoxamine 5'-phosphate oxidase family protein [Actinomycetes bacterium]MCP5033083.1 pyridoxamine 5'-phosphate oxidase family protein [Actinomycetes bacterium]